MNLRRTAALLVFVAAPLSAAENLDGFLEDQRARLNFPGLAALVLKNEAVYAEGAAGVRKSGSPERLTVHDKFHIGSNTIHHFCAWLAPARGFGVIAATNLGGGDVAQQIDEVVSELVRRYH